jgi:hypothetical protein
MRKAEWEGRGGFGMMLTKNWVGMVYLVAVNIFCTYFVNIEQR